MHPFFSIIIPVYNVAPYLRECLDSVLAQTFADWEAICVDDGSTDASSAMLDEYAAKDKRIRVIHQPNAGVSAARNRALDEAKGEWLAFLDSDDLLLEDFLLRLLDAAINAYADLAIGGVAHFDGKSGEDLVGPLTDGMFAPEDLYVEYNSLCAWSWGKIYKRSLWENVRFPVGIAYSEDRYIMHRILYAYAKVPFVAGALYRYRSRGNSAYGSAWKPEIAAQLHLALEEQMRFFHDKGFTKAEIFTLGLYFRWVGNDIRNLKRAGSADGQLFRLLREEYAAIVRSRWVWFARTTRREHLRHACTVGEIKILIDMVLSGKDRIAPARRALEIIMYDGLGAACRKLFRKTSHLIQDGVDDD